MILRAFFTVETGRSRKEPPIKHDTRDYEHGHGAEFETIRFRLSLAMEMLDMRSRMGWTEKQMWQAIQKRDWQSFPHTFLHFQYLNARPRSMADYLLRYPRLYDIVHAIYQEHSTRG
jgi:hypothetical protein